MRGWSFGWAPMLMLVGCSMPGSGDQPCELRYCSKLGCGGNYEYVCPNGLSCHLDYTTQREGLRCWRDDDTAQRPGGGLPLPVFGAPATFAAHGEPRGVGAADFDEDGRVDLAIGNGASGDVSILRGRGDGTFAAPVNLPLAAGAVPMMTYAIDLGGDGHADVLIMTRDGGDGITGFTVLAGDGGASFAAPVEYPAPSEALVAPTFGDFDGDGATDVARRGRRPRLPEPHAVRWCFVPRSIHPGNGAVLAQDDELHAAVGGQARL